MKFFPKTIDSQFLVRIIRNEVSSEEREFFEAWLQESDEHKEEFGNFVLLWDKIGNTKTPESPDAGKQFSAIKSKLQSLQTLPSEIIKGRITAKINDVSADQKIDPAAFGTFPNQRLADFIAWPLRIAASIAVIFLIYKFALNLNYTDLKQIPPQLNPVSFQMEIVTQKGEKSTVPLSDGTIVYLNANSRLRYPKVFSGTTRMVELIGEAYFSVAHNPMQPFIVSTGQTKTEVVGTEFNVRYRSNKLKLVVAKGAVKAYKDKSDKFVSITKGKMVTYSFDKGFSSPVKVDVHRYTAWRENKLSFVKAPLYEIMSEIESFYNVQVVYENKYVRNKTLTGIFDTDSLDNILSMISLTMDMSISRDGKKIIVR